MYIAIVKTESNRVSKFAEFKTKSEADAHVTKYGGQVHNNTLNTPIRDLWVDGAVTVVPVIDPPVVVVLDPDEFFDLFTVAEQDSIMSAMDASKPLQKWMFRLMMNRKGIDKAHPKVIAGMAALVKAGLITQKRSDEILA